jgi:hypothetical protein
MMDEERSAGMTEYGRKINQLSVGIKEEIMFSRSAAWRKSIDQHKLAK